MPDKNTQIKDLIEHNDELENYFRNTIIPQLFVDGNLRLQKFTPPAMKQFNLTSKDIGRHIDDVKENFRFLTILEDIQEVISSNEILEKEIQTTDMRWYQMNIIPYVKIKDNKTDGVIITFVEITMRIKNLQELEKLISEHEILLDTISHDIKNPLANLVLAIELFKTASPDDPQEFQTLLKIVDNAFNKMHKFIDELTAGRKAGHQQKASEDVLNIENLVEDIRLTLNNSITKSGSIIKTKIDVKEINFPKRKLMSIIYNLVSNAIKFSSPERKNEILISTRLEKEWTVIAVKDNGSGIAAGNLKDIFLKYYRVEDDIEGSGIGLYLVKEIVTNAGGKVEVESELGQGTTFSVYLKTD